VAELDAAAENSLKSSNSTLNKEQKLQSGGFWMETIERLGSQPYGNDKSYKVCNISCAQPLTLTLIKVFRNVTDYGAKGDGKTV
jgi:hypothetical protein